MRTLTQRRWTRRGFSLLWDPVSLGSFAAPDQVISMRQCFMLRESWPDELPSSSGDALVVAGLEGCLDALSPEDAASWLGRDLKSLVLDFQDFYEGNAALVLWLPGGRQRVRMEPAFESYSWTRPAPNNSQVLELGRQLWGGAEQDVARILAEADADNDGPAWVGLHHPRIS